MLKTKENELLGLSSAEVAASRRKYGSNALTKQKGKSFFCQFAEHYLLEESQGQIEDKCNTKTYYDRGEYSKHER